MTRSEYDQHADPAVRRRAAMRQVNFPPGVEPIRMAVGKINGEDVMLCFTTDGLYSIRDGVAHKCPETPARPFRRRSTDRDRRWLWIVLVGVATLVALWWTR